MGDAPPSTASPCSSNPLESIIAMPDVAVGKDAMKQFGFDEDYRNLNHGSFGTYPKAIREVLRHYQDRAEARPCDFILYQIPLLLDQQREALATYVNAPTSNCVFVQNATTGINTVLRNLVFQPGDVIIYFATIYGACEKTVSFITETTPAESRKIHYTYPVSDSFLCDAFERTVSELRSEGKNPRICIFDTIVSMPGVRMPFEQLTKLCRKHGVLSCIDGAHGIGLIPLDLSELDPDFFVTNCHKWLYVPRGCALFYVPERNQKLMRSTLPTSHGFVPLPKPEEEVIKNPLVTGGKSNFVANFDFAATIDWSPYFCVSAALQWRSKLCWNDLRGEEAVYAYLQHLARKAGPIVAKALSDSSGKPAEILENEEQTLGRCSLTTIKLPLSYHDVAGGDYATGFQCWVWMKQTLIQDYKTFIPIVFYDDSWWVRLSAQVYLIEEDFEWAGQVLKKLCERVKHGDWKP